MIRRQRTKALSIFCNSHLPSSFFYMCYIDDGEEALEPRHGTPCTALTTSKSLSELDRLRLLVAKQEVEIARLKKVTGRKELAQTKNTLLAAENYEIIERTLLIDPFNNEIIAHSASLKAGDTKPYYHCLDILMQKVGKTEEQGPQVVFHTDQGAAYSSRAFCQAHLQYSIIRSMSREGALRPTIRLLRPLMAGLKSCIWITASNMPMKSRPC